MLTLGSLSAQRTDRFDQPQATWPPGKPMHVELDQIVDGVPQAWHPFFRKETTAQRDLLLEVSNVTAR